jgi:glycerol-3-phosphate dehydrogenase
MTLRARVDVIILGGGIAGLWTLARLRAAGYRCLLLEPRALGGVQTLASQGIIHGGTKYALTGRLTGSSQAIAAMPGIWRACLDGGGELDLSRVRVLSEHQYLWSDASLGSQLAGFFAGKLMRSRIRPVSAGERPTPLQAPAFRGSVYRLEEPVLDTAALAAELARQLGEQTRLLERPEALELHAGQAPGLTLTPAGGESLRIDCQRLILSAGAGNGPLLARLGWRQPAQQLRPLHMLLLRGPLPPFFAHCLGPSANPRLTVTSYPAGADEQVWYLGGEVAERGVERSTAQQIAAGRRELTALLPWLDQSDSRWATLPIDRAEPAQPQGRRPDRCFVADRDGVLVAWPTKLAFAPELARQVLDRLQAAGVRPQPTQEEPLARLPRPPLGQPIWEHEQTWN